MIFLILISLIACLYLYNGRKSKLSPRLPPGPWNTPIIGNLHWMSKFPWENFSKFGEIYGPLAYVKLGKRGTIFINDISTWKDAYRRPELSRQSGKFFETTLKNKSIVFGDGNPEIKQYMSRTLNEFGKDSLENLTMGEVSLLLQKFEESREKPVPVKALFPIPTVNLLWMLLFGKRLKDDDFKMHQLIRGIINASSDSSFVFRKSILLLIPFVSKLFPSVSMTNHVRDFALELVQIIEKEIQEHNKTRQNSQVRDITDAYFDQVERTDPKSNSFLTEDDSLQFIYTGLFVAAVDSTSSSLEWLLLCLATNPCVQVKFQAEIDDIIGNRKPSLNDRDRMPYTLAVIQETFRLAVIDINQFHQAKENSTLLGYDIPKGTVLIPNVYGINRDPKIWGDADAFRPDRFIGSDGKYQKSNKFITFGYGRRSCPGESIARNQIFLFATSIFQRFSVSIYGEAPPFNGKFGIFHHANPFEVVFKNRSNTNVQM